MATAQAERPRGLRARSEAKRAERLRKMRAKSGNRYRIHYDIDGPRVRLGILWFLGAIAAFASRPVGPVAYFTVAFAAAASHALRTWRARGARVDPRTSLVGTALVVAAAGFGTAPMGIAVMVLAAGAVAISVAGLGESDTPVQAFAETGFILQTALPSAVAGGCLVLLADIEIWAAISLVVLCSAYETGDYLVGSGAANAVEGPLAGGVAVLVSSAAVAALGFLPFTLGESMLLGVATFPAAVLGQLLGSVMLPHSRAYAPALRRIDSYLLVAPIWFVATGIWL